MTSYGLWSLTATILYKDFALLDFTVEQGRLISYSIHSENSALLPLELSAGININALNSFVDARIVPRERYDISELLKAVGIDEYRWDPILKTFHGLCTDDCYWFLFPGEDFKYSMVKLRD